METNKKKQIVSQQLHDDNKIKSAENKKIESSTNESKIEFNYKHQNDHLYNIVYAEGETNNHHRSEHILNQPKQKKVNSRDVLSKELSNNYLKTILLLNIDNFNFINSTYGFEIGDLVLNHVTNLLLNYVPFNGELYKLSGDEYVILLKKPQPLQGSLIAKLINDSYIKNKISLNNIEFKITFTIGIAHGMNNNILRNADIALRQARKIRKNSYSVYKYDSNLEKKNFNNIKWANVIKNALEHNNVVPYFQPILNNRTMKIEKYECLARIIINDKVILPDKFIAAAKRAGLISYITQIIIDKSFHFFSHNDYSFSINITEDDLNDKYLLPFLLKKCSQYHIDPERVTLEILEGIDLFSNTLLISQLKKLKKFGVKLAFDDFGVGHSNFSGIMELNVDYVKIDGSFIKNMANDDRSFKITRAIAKFCKSIGTEIIAEFVHNEETFIKVKQLGIDYSQGYFFGKPSPNLHN